MVDSTIRIAQASNQMTDSDVEFYRNALESLVAQHRLAKESREVWQRCLESDDGMEEWIQKNIWKPCPIVRANVYGDQTIDYWQEICGWRERSDGRRPVIMRGSKGAMIHAHSHSNSNCGNGLCIEILERYLRFIKFSSAGDWRFDEKFIRGKAKRLSERFYVTYHFWQRVEEIAIYPMDRHCRKWENGELVWISRDNKEDKEPATPVTPIDPEAIGKIQMHVAYQFGANYRTKRGRRRRAILRAVEELGLMNPEEMI